MADEFASRLHTIEWARLKREIYLKDAFLLIININLRGLHLRLPYAIRPMV